MRYAKQPSTIVVGSRVRVRADIKEPHYKWGKVKHGCVGVVAKLRSDGSTPICDVDFEEQKGGIHVTSIFFTQSCYPLCSVHIPLARQVGIRSHEHS